jgi:hypothetical protein
MNSPLPVIFLAFANEYQGGRYLNKLVEEHRQLYAALGPVSLNEAAGNGKALCELVVRQNATIQDIFDVFQKYEERIAVFHYGGHADGYQLLLQGKDGEGKVAHGGGLVSLLSRRKNLKLVFLNGCSTQKLAHDLAGRGVPTVIGTSASIPDTMALQISSRFFNGLARGLTLAGAWEEAKAEVMTGIDPKDVHRGFQLSEDDEGRFPWDVEFKDEASKELFNSWNLPGAANQPLFGLPEPKKQNLPASPFLFLKPYNAEHAEIFFGRSYYIRDLYLKILEQSSPPIILLFGESGAGKSSLLDAGLRPRLSAATHPETGQPLFEVRYRRRDQDLGLVGTLADVLSYYTEGIAEEAGDPDDPNLDKIAAIESIAKELDSDAAGSFLNLIDRYKAVRNYRAGSEYRRSLYQTGDLDAYASARLRQAWLDIEKKSGHKLVVILDQVEELYTRPNPKMEKELEDLLRVMYELFATPADRVEDEIRGKIILGYREEFNAKIEARVKEFGLPRGTVFLEQLNKKDILDIFQGLESPVVKDHYNISVEKGLPEHVANQLLAGKDSVSPGQRPVAPVLQLLLTKLWNKAYRENNHQPAFTIDAFNEVESQGKEMEEYYIAQMRKVEAWKPEVVLSGLALDILAYHISDLGTSRRCSIEDIRMRYRHLASEYPGQANIVDQLVDQLKSSDIFLLNDNGRGYTSLPHDTLAPIIMREYNRSDKLGQRSTRILDTKRPDFIRALQSREEQKVRLDDNDLEVVTGGIRGMRALEEEEKTLLQISIEEREKRLRLRRILVRGGIVTGLFMLFLAVMSGMLSVSVMEQLRNVVVDRAHQESVKLQENYDDSYKNYLLAMSEGLEGDPALRLAHFSYFGKKDERRVDIVRNYYQLAYPIPEGEKQPFFLSLAPGANILGLQYDPLLGPIATLSGGSSLTCWPASRFYEQITINFEEMAELYFSQEEEGLSSNFERQASYTVDGKGVQMALRYDVRALYEMAGQLVESPTVMVTNYTEVEGETLQVVVGYYDLFSGELIGDFGSRFTEEEFYKAYGDLALYIGEEEIYPETLFSYRLLDGERQVFLDSTYREVQSFGWDIAGQAPLDLILQTAVLAGKDAQIPLKPAGHFSRGRNNYCMVWAIDTLSGNQQPDGEFFYSLPLDYLSAINKDSFLTVTPEGEVAIRDKEGAVLVSLLRPGKGISNIGVSPDHKRLFAVSGDSVLIWGLNGARLAVIHHPGIKSHGFSADGSRLFTCSPDRVKVWPADGKALKEFVNDAEGYQIAATRFHDDAQHLVIGLDPLNNSTSQGLLARVFRRKGPEARIEYWNAETGVVKERFEAPCGRLQDVSLSADGKFAVAIDRDQAFVIPSPSAKVRRWEYHRDGIMPLPVKKGTLEKPQRVFLSPAGKYIVRQSAADGRIELFDLRGKPVNAYRFGQYSPGFGEAAFSPGDYYLIARKSEEVFFWHPEDGAIPWPEVYELSLDEKREYQLTTVFDYIPGWNDTAKWWAISLIILAIVYSLVFFSGAIIEYIQQKDFLSLGLYGLAFALLSLIFAECWVAGTDDPVLKKIAFYGLIFANLGILSIGVYNAFRRKKFQSLAATGMVGILLAAGLVRFFTLENRHLPKGDFEWSLLWALLLIAAFAGLAGYPIFRAINKYRKGEKAAFYNWLLLPAGFAAIAIWGGIGYYDDYFATDTTALLNTVSTLVLLGVAIHKGWNYLINRSFAKLLVFGLPALIGLSFLATYSYGVFLAIPALFFYGWNASEEKAYPRMYLWFVGCIFLAVGSVFYSIVTGNIVPVLGLALLAPFLALVFFALAWQMEVLEEKTSGRMLNWLAILGLWVAVFVASGIYTFETNGPSADFTEYDDFTEPEQPEGDLLESVMMGNPVWQAEYNEANGQSTFVKGEDYFLEFKDGQVVAEFAVKEITQEYVELYDGTRDLWLRIFETETFFTTGDDPEWKKLFDGVWIYPVPEEETPAGPAGEMGAAPEPEAQDQTTFRSDLQNQVSELFANDEETRNEARRQLLANWLSDPGLVREMSEFGRSNPSMNEGLWNTLYILEKMTDEQLSAHKDEVLDYLTWLSGRGYGPSTMERINGVRGRIE